MSRQIYIQIVVLILISLGVTNSNAAPDAQRQKLMEEVSKELSGGGPIELGALEIKARLFEPQVIYILDRSKLDVDLSDEKIQLTPRILEDVLRESRP